MKKPGTCMARRRVPIHHGRPILQNTNRARAKGVPFALARFLRRAGNDVSCTQRGCLATTHAQVWCDWHIAMGVDVRWRSRRRCFDNTTLVACFGFHAAWRTPRVAFRATRTHTRVSHAAGGRDAPSIRARAENAVRCSQGGCPAITHTPRAVRLRGAGAYRAR